MLNAERGGGAEAVGTSSTKPNVFFFLIDDMGFGDIGYQSTDLSQITPNLDALAAGGVKVIRLSWYSWTEERGEGFLAQLLPSLLFFRFSRFPGKAASTPQVSQLDTGR